MTYIMRYKNVYFYKLFLIFYKRIFLKRLKHTVLTV